MKCGKCRLIELRPEEVVLKRGLEAGRRRGEEEEEEKREGEGSLEVRRRMREREICNTLQSIINSRSVGIPRMYYFECRKIRHK